MPGGSSSYRKSSSSLSLASSNWKNLQPLLPQAPAAVKERNAEKRRTRSQYPLPSKKYFTEGTAAASPSSQASLRLVEILQNNVTNPSATNQTEAGKYLAIDCEMVGVGPKGCQSVLARVSIVNYYGNIILDAYVRPKERVTDYRTWVSGIKPQHLYNAESFENVVAKVAGLIENKVLIGHAIHHDLQALLLTHPRALIRDTAAYPPLRAIAQTNMPGLKKLALLLLGVKIQAGSHSSVDDARATIAIYRTQKDEWEALVKKEQLAHLARATPTQHSN